MNEDHIDRKAIVQQIVELQTKQKRLEAELAEGDNIAPDALIAVAASECL